MQKMLDGFSCPRNQDVERFLKRQAITNERSNRSRTYILVAERETSMGPLDILGFFTLATGLTKIEPSVSKSKKQKLAGLFYDPSSGVQTTPCFLIGQIGLNDRFHNVVDGDLLVKEALDAILVSWINVGGRFVRADCTDSPGLISFHERHGFELIQRNERTKLVEMALIL